MKHHRLIPVMPAQQLDEATGPSLSKKRDRLWRSRFELTGWRLIFCFGSEIAPARSCQSSVDHALVLGLIHQSTLLDPWHHVAELEANLLDRVLRELGTGRLERGLVHLV